MSSQGYDFTTGKFDVHERGVLGWEGPTIIKLKIGMALFRAICEFGTTGLAQGALDTVPDMPSVLISAFVAGSRIKISTGISADVIYADPNGTVSYDWLGSEKDNMECVVECLDTSYTSGDIACPMVKTWCEALGGTYYKAT